MFNFLFDLVRWFLYGSNSEQPFAEHENCIDPDGPVEPIEKSTNTKIPKIEVVQDIKKMGNREQFLDELRSIQPSKKEFEKDRDDLVKEIKKLSNRGKK